MFKSLATTLTNTLIDNEIINSDEFNIYRYGLETLIYFVVNISVALLLGVIFDRVIHTILFLACYCTVRQFSGGYHARNYTECTITFVVIYLITIFTINNIDIQEYKYLLLSILLLSDMIIYKICPLEHRNNPLNEVEKKVYKKTVLKLITVISIIIGISLGFDILTNYIIYPYFALIWICLLLIIGTYIKH